MNDGFDVLRVVNTLLCSLTFLLMLGGMKRHGQEYNKKTRDYWYGRLMWAVTGIVISFEGIRTNATSEFVPVAVLFAVVVTLKGILQKGPWGHPTYDEKLR